MATKVQPTIVKDILVKMITPRTDHFDVAFLVILQKEMSQTSGNGGFAKRRLDTD